MCLNAVPNNSCTNYSFDLFWYLHSGLSGRSCTRHLFAPIFSCHRHPSPPLFAPWQKRELLRCPGPGRLRAGQGGPLHPPARAAPAPGPARVLPGPAGRRVPSDVTPQQRLLGLDPARGRWGPRGAPRLTPLLLGTSDPAPLPSSFGGTRDHPGSGKGRERRSSERLSQEGTAQHGQRSRRIAEKGDVWFVLTAQTDALRHVCIYGIHMLSWERRGQQHQTGIGDANAKKTYAATRLCVCTCSCEGACS